MSLNIYKQEFNKLIYSISSFYQKIIHNWISIIFENYSQKKLMLSLVNLRARFSIAK